MGSKKAQTIGYKYYAYGHFVLCHGPIDAITKIQFQDKDAFTSEKSSNQRIYINKPNLFGGDEQSGGVQGNIDLLFGYQDQEKNATIKKICGDLVSAWRGITSVVFDNVYIGTSPSMPDSKWRVKRIHTRHLGETQWYDQKAELANISQSNPEENIATPLGEVTVFSSCNYHSNNPNNVSSTITANENVYVGDIWIHPAYAEPSAEYTFKSSNEQFFFHSETQITSGGGWVIIVYQAGFGNIGQRPFDPKMFKADFYGLIPEIGDTVEEVLSSRSVRWIVTLKSRPRTVTANITGDLYQDSNGSWFFNHSAGIVGIYQEVESTGDMNPAHIIRECLTNSLWGKGADSSVIDDDSFTAAADTLYEEGMGISIVWSSSSTIKEFISNILDHINGELYVDRTTNLWTLKLIREDYDADTLEIITESQYKSLEFERKTLAECVNQVTVTYYDRERAKDSTVSVQDIGRIAQQGGTIAQEVDYKGFTNSGIASRAALRDLKTLSSELATISFDTTEDVAIAWNRGHVFKFSSTKYGLDEAIFRITEIKFGDGVDNTVSVEAIEDSFSSPMQAVVEYTATTKTDKSAKDATAIAFEVPYIELVEQYGQDEIDAKLEKNPDLSFVGMAAVRPNNYHINASLYSNAGAGYAEEATLDFCPNATLKADIGYLDASFEVENVAEFELLQANNRLQIDDEFVAFVSFDSATNILTVKRGVADTVPAKHTANARIYGWDNYSGLDSTEYLSGETVAMKALTLTGSDILELSEATAHSVTCSARAIRPYPPANIKLNNEYYPDFIDGHLAVTWSHRNRLQQTGGSILGWTDAGVTLESGATYTIEIYDLETNALKYQVSEITDNSYVVDASNLATHSRIEIYSKRYGYKSYQIFKHEFYSSALDAPYDLNLVYIPDLQSPYDLTLEYL